MKTPEIKPITVDQIVLAVRYICTAVDEHKGPKNQAAATRALLFFMLKGLGFLHETPNTAKTINNGNSSDWVLQLNELINASGARRSNREIVQELISENVESTNFLIQKGVQRMKKREQKDQEREERKRKAVDSKKNPRETEKKRQKIENK